MKRSSRDSAAHGGRPSATRSRLDEYCHWLASESFGYACLSMGRGHKSKQREYYKGMADAYLSCLDKIREVFAPEKTR